jgi:D-aminoacyl-tRNA deacylase
MRAVVQRVQSASVYVGEELISKIGPGLLTLLGIRSGDTEREAEWLIKKLAALRIFEDASGKMNLSLLDTKGEHMIVSQFTLWADASKGNRPSFIEAARPEVAKPLYEKALALSEGLGLPTVGGKFQATMRVVLENDGPVTIILDSPVSAATQALR